MLERFHSVQLILRLITVTVEHFQVILLVAEMSSNQARVRRHFLQQCLMLAPRQLMVEHFVLIIL